MNSAKVTNSTNINVGKQEQAISSENHLLRVQPQKLDIQEPTFGQKLADSMAAKVGSWAFLIGQTSVLAGWVVCNSVPGLPHWDESPFILLNLVFSFASAYTAPIVLMSQNRQSDEDRQNAALNHNVNLQTAQNLELLHGKFDELYSQKLAELTEIVKQQQSANGIKVVLSSVQTEYQPVNVEAENSLFPSSRFPVKVNSLNANQVQATGEFFKPLTKVSTINPSEKHRSN